MRSSAFLYPWDVIGDPAAARRVAGTGVRQVTLASAYHSTRALTPRHPRHRVVTARHAAVYYPPDPARWRGRALRPRPQSWIAADDAFGQAARALRAEGLSVHSWVILAHNSRLGEEHPRAVVSNAFGDRYPWALCIARPEVREFCADLAAEAAVRPGAQGTELESCGWYGFAHLHAHDKIGGVPLGGAAQYLMSLCFCEACREGYRAVGLDPAGLRSAVVAALGPLWAAGEPGPGADPGTGPGPHTGPGADSRAVEWAGVEKLLGADLAAATLAHRTAVAGSFQRAMVEAVRWAAGTGDFRIMLHADPAPHRCGANVGVDPVAALRTADGLVLPCSAGERDLASVLEAAGAGRRCGSVLAANVNVVEGMGGRPGELAGLARRAAGHGADELRLYHAGLASDRDLDLVRSALSDLGTGAGEPARRHPAGNPPPG